jgi:RNA polymerase sigma-70 factor (ECF subfamily)
MATKRKASTPSTSDQRVGEAWRTERRYLVGMASRMLHGGPDAEDVVQEAFSRLARADVDEIDDLRGWLMVVVRHLCLDLLNSAHSRRSTAPGWLADDGTPVLGERPGNPADRVTLDDEVQLALALVLDRLSPAERTAFVLHDVFGFPFDAVGDLVGRTPAACRQLASRARSSIRRGAGADHAPIQITRSRILAERFIAACAGGDIAELMALLDPDVVGEATLEGHGPFVLLEGRKAVADRIFQLFGPGTDRTLVPVPVDGTPGVVALDHGRVMAVFRLDGRDGIIHHFRGVVRRPPPATASRRR